MGAGDTATERVDASAMLGIGTALLYAATAISMNFVNKATLDAFPLAWVVMCCQMAATVVLVGLLRVARLVVFPRLSWGTAQQLAPVSAFYALNTAFALLGLRSLNIPMYSTLKRLTPMIVLLLKVAFTRNFPSRSLAASVACVVAGCIVAGIGDLTFDVSGYMCALTSCLLQALYLLMVEFRGSNQHVGAAEMLFYNAILSLPFLMLAAVLSGEYSIFFRLYTSAAAASASFPVLLATCAILGTLLNLSLFLCTINNSALTTTIVGVLKGVLTTALGFFFLGGVQFNLLNVVGILLNTVGGVCYTFIKYREKNNPKDVWRSASPRSPSKLKVVIDPLTELSPAAVHYTPHFIQIGSEHAQNGVAQGHVSSSRERKDHGSLRSQLEARFS